MHVNAVDAVAAGLVGLGAVFGARRGFVSQVARLLALAGGLVGARMVLPETSALLRHAAPSLAPPLDRYVAFLATFGIGVAAVLYAAARIEERVKAGSLAPVDRAGGALVGGAKGVLVCYVALFAALCLPARLRPLGKEIRESRTAPILLGRAWIGVAGPLFPEEFEARGTEVVRDIEIARAAEERRNAEGAPQPAPSLPAKIDAGSDAGAAAPTGAPVPR